MLSALYGFVIEPVILIITIAFAFAFGALESRGLSIIFVSLVVNLLCLPLYRMADAKQDAERAMQKSMEHWVTHIKKHFKGDEQYMMLSTYYRQRGYRPISALSSSLSLLLQIPVFIAAYRFLSDLELLKGFPFLFIRDLGSPDAILTFGTMSINVLPIVMTAINIASSAIYTRTLPLRDKVQTFGLAVLFLILLYDSPAGLVMYWTCNQVFSLVKNAFSKADDTTRKRLVYVTETTLALGLIAALLTGKLATPRRVLLALLCMLFAQVPLFLPTIKTTLAGITNWSTLIAPLSTRQTSSRAQAASFFLAAALCSTILGVMVPLELIGSSPAEFVNMAYFIDPLDYVVHDVIVYAGLFVLWVGVYFYLSDAKARDVLTFGLLCVAMVSLVDYLGFGGNMGIIESDLTFESAPAFTLANKLLNVAALIVIVLALCVARAKAPHLMMPIMVITLISIVSVSAPNLFKTRSTVNDMIESTKGDASLGWASLDDAVDENGEPLPLFNLSKSGRNVVVLFIDRGLGSITPYILDEFPQLRQQLDGFTYYRNTISFGGHTIFGAPPLYGGYDYVPSAMNARSTELLVDKTNEAIKVMPTLFSEAGFNVCVTDPAYLDYNVNTYDFSTLADIPNLKAYHTEGTYSTPYYEAYAPQRRLRISNNFLYYSLFKCVPVVLQPMVYHDGHYLSFPGTTQDVSTRFLDSWPAIEKLSSLTAIDEGDSDNFLLMHNMLCHSPNYLQLPDYMPTTNVNKSLEKHWREASGYDGLALDTYNKTIHYHVNARFLLDIGEWCDYLRAQGVYDNTRIIIVSDHGAGVASYVGSLLFSETSVADDGNRFLPLFMVKDFNAKGFNTSLEFMTNADTPSMALAGIVANPTNPFTGTPITQDAKNDQDLMIISSRQMLQSGTTYDDQGLGWYSVHDDAYDPANWTYYPKM